MESASVDEIYKPTLTISEFAIEVSDEEIDAELGKIAEGSKQTPAELKAQLKKEDRLESFKQHLQENKAFDFIYRNAKITME